MTELEKTMKRIKTILSTHKMPEENIADATLLIAALWETDQTVLKTLEGGE